MRVMLMLRVDSMAPIRCASAMQAAMEMEVIAAQPTTALQLTIAKTTRTASRSRMVTNVSAQQDMPANIANKSSTTAHKIRASMEFVTIWLEVTNALAIEDITGRTATNKRTGALRSRAQTWPLAWATIKVTNAYADLVILDKIAKYLFRQLKHRLQLPHQLKDQQL
jgi:hypothetical protein